MTLMTNTDDSRLPGAMQGLSRPNWKSRRCRMCGWKEFVLSVWFRFVCIDPGCAPAAYLGCDGGDATEIA